MIVEFDIGNGIKVKFNLVEIAMLLSGGTRKARRHYKNMLKDQLDLLAKNEVKKDDK